MSQNIIFCEKCRDYVGYSIKEAIDEEEYKGKMYRYLKKTAYCNICGEEIFVPEVFDYNIEAFNKSYRETNGIITVDKIKEILVKYNIGKRPLSLLLGWGELTYTRYCDGDMPTKQYSEVLEHIYNDPRYYLELLEKNKDNLKSEKAYNKSRRATFDLFEGIEISEKEEPMVARINKVSDIIFKIVKARIDLNISKIELAKKTGIKESTLEEIEALKIVPRIDTLIKLCDALNLKLVLEIKDK